MAIRVRKIKGRVVALCAAKSSPAPGDIYLDDAVHHALMHKFSGDFKAEGIGIADDYDPAAVELGAG